MSIKIAYCLLIRGLNETYMRLIKKFFLFASEIVVLFLGFLLSLGFALGLYSAGYNVGLLVFILGFPLVCAAVVWFRRKTGKWMIAADAEAFLVHRSWQQLHPRRAKYYRDVRRSIVWLPSILGAFVLFFLPVASHIVCFGGQVVPHYRVSFPLNWLVIKSQGMVWAFFTEEGASRYGLTTIWFNHRMPSSGVFLTRSPKDADTWSRPASELSNGHTHVAVREFRLGMITASCYEYRKMYGKIPEASSGILSPPVLWASDCFTHPNGIDYNLSSSFFGHREDLPAFYKVLDSATASPD